MINQNNGQVCWNLDWLNDFESPWSIFEKIKYANSASIHDLLFLFGNPKVKKIRTIPGKGHRDLYTLNGVNDEAAKKFLGFSIRNKNDENIIRITRLLPKNIEGNSIYFDDTLVFCKKCMEVGYHSILHQFKLLKTCPFHMVSLSSECPKCNRTFPYILSDDYTSSPYHCLCGHSFLQFNNQSVIASWKQTTDNIIDPITNKWIKINECTRRLDKVYFNYDFYNQSDSRLLEVLISHFDSNTIRHNDNFYSSLSRIYFNSDLKLTDEELHEEIYKTTYSTYKSYVRYLKRTILKEHKNCIKLLKKNSPNIEICPYAFAFVHWRKSIEGLSNFSDVENRNKMKRDTIFNYQFEFASKQDTIQLNKIINELKITFKENLTNQQLIWVINKIMFIVIRNHFYNWLNMAKELARQNLKIHYIPFEYENIPLFLVYLDEIENTGTQLKLIEFPTGSLDDLINMSCPYIIN